MSGTSPHTRSSSSLTMAAPKHVFAAARALLSIPVAAFIKSEAAHLPSGSGIVVVHARERVGDALIKLARHSILSAPLIDEAGRVAGFFDIKNVVKAFTASDTEEIEVIRANIGPGEPDSHPLKKPLRGRFVDLPVAELPASSDGHYLFSESDPQLRNVSMHDLVQTCLLRGSSHRVAVYIPIGETGLELLTIVSSSNVIRYLFERCDAFDSMASTSLADLGLVYRGIADRVPRGVIRVDASAAALDAFELMAVHDVSALAIVDSAGKLVANLSPSDLRVVLPDNFGVLERPVRGLLELECAGGYGMTDGVVTAFPGTPLRSCLHRLVTHKLHHLYVVDHLGHPLAVVSATDILSLFSQEE